METPTIRLIDVTTKGMDESFMEQLRDALQQHVDEYIEPAWRTPAHIVISTYAPEGDWVLLFVDDPDVANALGYHDLTPAGFPMGKVFVEYIEALGESVALTASHEVAEMLVDPSINLGAYGPRKAWYALEIADPVQGNSVEVNGLPMTDFVLPAWFEEFRQVNSVQFSYLDTVYQPFQLDQGGWIPVFRKGRWGQLFGSKQARSAFGKLEQHPRTTNRRAGKKLKKSKARVNINRRPRS